MRGARKSPFPMLAIFFEVFAEINGRNTNSWTFVCLWLVRSMVDEGILANIWINHVLLSSATHCLMHWPIPSEIQDKYSWNVCSFPNESLGPNSCNYFKRILGVSQRLSKRKTKWILIFCICYWQKKEGSPSSCWKAIKLSIFLLICYLNMPTWNWYA